MKTNTKTILLFIMSFALITIIGVSYSYFTASIVQNDVKDQVVTTGTLSLRYVDGAEVVMQNIKPGDTITKTVYVANTGTLDASYNLVWQELTNEITNDEMLIEGTCTRLNGTTEEVDGTCEGIDSTAIASNIIKSRITIEPSIVHKYDLTITFKDTNAAQNYNQGKKFSGVLGINEYKKIDPVSFSADSWTTIADAVKDKNTSKYNIGDTKKVTLKTLGTYTVRVANNSTSNECSDSDFSQTACGFVLEFTETFENRLNYSTNVGGWPGSTIREYVNTIYEELPDDLKSVIINTTVVSGHGKTDSSNFVSTDKLYLLAPGEIYSDWTSENDTAKDLTRQLDYYKEKGVTTSNYSNATKTLYGLGTEEESLLRTANAASDAYYFEVDITGALYDSSNKAYVSPAFRIG